MQHVLTEHSTDDLIPVTTLVSILPTLLAGAETTELSAFTDYVATFRNSRPRTIVISSWGNDTRSRTILRVSKAAAAVAAALRPRSQVVEVVVDRADVALARAPRTTESAIPIPNVK